MANGPLVYFAEIRQGKKVLIHVEGLVQRDGDIERLICNELFNEFRKQYPNQNFPHLNPALSIFVDKK